MSLLMYMREFIIYESSSVIIYECGVGAVGGVVVGVSVVVLVLCLLWCGCWGCGVVFIGECVCSESTPTTTPPQHHHHQQTARSSRRCRCRWRRRRRTRRRRCRRSPSTSSEGGTSVRALCRGERGSVDFAPRPLVCFLSNPFPCDPLALHVCA